MLRVLRAAVPALLAVVAIAACNSAQSPSFTAAERSAPPISPVAVVRGDITSVVVLDATVAATPEFALTAPARGKVQRAKRTEPNRAIKRGMVLGTVGSSQLRAPADGFVDQWLVPSGVKVSAGVPVVSLRLTGFALSATVPAKDAFRVLSGGRSARGQITNGPGPFDCPLLPASGEGAGAQVLCAIPDKERAYDGVPGLLALKTAERKGVLTVPIAAVTAIAGKGEVWKLVDGEPVRTAVETGITDGVRVEIVSGLADGDEVLPYSPSLRRPNS